MPVETELKLGINAADIEAFKQHPHLQAATATMVQKQLTGYYFDTPNHDLRRLKTSLRVRREGEQWVQAVKAKGQSVGGLHQRQEWEADVSGLQAEFDVLPDEARTLMQPFWQDIQQVFVTDFARTTWQLTCPDNTKIELCLDLGEVKAGDKQLPIQEIELELKQGDAANLYQIAIDLLDAGIGLHLENTSKAQRGYALHHPPEIAAVSLSAPVIAPTTTLQTALPTLIQSCLETLQSNEAAALQGDEQAKHNVQDSLATLTFCLHLGTEFDTTTAPLLQSVQALSIAKVKITELLQSSAYTRLLLSLSAWLYAKSA